MHRFYCPYQNITRDKIIISDKEQAHHLKDVLRLKVNDEVAVFDERSNEYTCLIKELLKDEVILDIKARRIVPENQKVRITIACAIPKKSKMDNIIDKLTQLGADRIIPMLTGHTIVKLDKHKRIFRLKRWQKIAQSASQQSQRNTLPIIEPITDIEEVLSMAGDYDLKLIPTLIGERKLLKDIFTNKSKNILVLIGPEGDFTADEISVAEEKGFIPISLGDLVLRVETAAVVVASFIRLYANR